MKLPAATKKKNLQPPDSIKATTSRSGAQHCKPWHTPLVLVGHAAMAPEPAKGTNHSRGRLPFKQTQKHGRGQMVPKHTEQVD